MVIRKATVADMPRLVEMSIRFLTETPYGQLMLPIPEKIEAFILQVMQLGAVIISQTDNMPGYKVTGMIGLMLITHPITGEIHADECAWWVEPEHRRSNIGPYLLRSAEVWATTNRAKVCKMTAPAGTEVGAFYKRMGYVEVETIFYKQLTLWDSQSVRSSDGMRTTTPKSSAPL